MAKLKVKTKEERISEALNVIRAERNRRLAETDYLVIKAYETNSELSEEVIKYRQALRDLPEKLTEEEILSGNINWPEKPF